MVQSTKTDVEYGSWWIDVAALCCRTPLLLLSVMLLLSGCARLTIAGPDAARLSSAVVARLDAETLFAAASDGKQVAFSHGGVRVMPLPSGESRSLSAERPLALAWSPDGGRLAAAFRRGTESRITVFGADGATLAETAAAGHVVALRWTGADALLAVVMELDHHKFGTSCREVLLRWPLAGTPERTVLHETTLKPYTVRRWADGLLARAISPGFSPLGDELVYGRIQDPPAFDAYLRVVVRNISSGAEREIVKTGFADGTARFSADGEDLFISDVSDRVRRFAAWSDVEKQMLPFSGRSLSVSPDGRHLLVDGRLLDDGREIARFTPKANGDFLADGRLLVVDNDTLYLVSGFETSAVQPAVPPEKQERLRTIRAWRASGLISADDYVAAREKVMK